MRRWLNQFKQIEIDKRLLEQRRKKEEKDRKAAEARQTKLDNMTDSTRVKFLRREEATRQRRLRQLEIASAINSPSGNMNRQGSIDINNIRDAQITVSDIEDNNDINVSTTNNDNTDRLTNNQNVMMNNNINNNNSSGSSSSSFFINNNVRSRSGRAILSAALLGSSYPCGCGCEKSYDGLTMVTCRGCSQLYVNKRCNVTWKCSNCSI